MIDRSHALPLLRQARELGISRGSVYYLPKPVSAADLAIMRRIDELHLESFNRGPVKDDFERHLPIYDWVIVGVHSDRGCQRLQLHRRR